MSEKANVPQQEPFVGPRAFQRGEKIYGRDAEILALKNSLLSGHVMLLHALSGAGKTSLIQAGLAPALEPIGFYTLPLARVNLPLDPQLAEAFPHPPNRYRMSLLISLEMELEKQNIIPPSRRIPLKKLAGLSLVKYLELRSPPQTPSSPAPAGPPTKTQKTPWRLLLVLDQFEELITLNPGDDKARKEFFAWMMPALQDPRFWFLFSMRDDFVGGLEPYLDYIPNRLRTRYRLEFLNPENAFQAVTKPTEEIGGVIFQKNAARKLVDNLRAINTSEATPNNLGPYVEPIQLQVVCLKLWHKRTPDAKKITLADVDKSGSVDEALSEYYTEVLDRVCGEDLPLNRTFRDWIQKRLIINDTFRDRSNEYHLGDYGLNKEKVKPLIDAYLLRSDDYQGQQVYVLTHDRLVKPVVEANRRWREEKLEDWQKVAERWDRDGRPANLLLNEAGLKQIEQQEIANPTKYNSSKYSKIDRAFLEASRAASQAEQSRSSDPEKALRARLGLNLEEVGWGVIFHQNVGGELPKALAELLDLRAAQAGKNHKNYFHIFSGLSGYRPEDREKAAEKFLERNKDTGGPVNPENVPYYLLIVGDPESIPFQFQYDLSRRYSVGRIYFPRLEHYQSYARSVRVCENEPVVLPNSAAVFSPTFPKDSATQEFFSKFTRPLLTEIRKRGPNWNIGETVGPEANRARLKEMLGGTLTPALLAAVSWGAGMPIPPESIADLGALVTSDWPGPSEFTGKIRREHFFSAQDIEDNARLLGMIVMLISGYSAGAPRTGDFSFMREPEQGLAQAMLAELPQRLLSHPLGGALAVIGHVDKIWTSSFTDASGASDLRFYLDLVDRLMQGSTVGAAMDLLSQRAARENARVLSAQLSPQPLSQTELQTLLVRAVDARNYLLIGDPAVRLPVIPARQYSEPAADWIRPVINPVTPIVLSATGDPGETPATPASSELWFASGIIAGSGAYAVLPASTQQMIDQFYPYPQDNLETSPGDSSR